MEVSRLFSTVAVIVFTLLFEHTRAPVEDELQLDEHAQTGAAKLLRLNRILHCFQRFIESRSRFEICKISWHTAKQKQRGSGSKKAKIQMESRATNEVHIISMRKWAFKSRFKQFYRGTVLISMVMALQSTPHWIENTLSTCSRSRWHTSMLSVRLPLESFLNGYFFLVAHRMVLWHPRHKICTCKKKYCMCNIANANTFPPLRKSGQRLIIYLLMMEWIVHPWQLTQNRLCVQRKRTACKGQGNVLQVHGEILLR